MFGFFKKKDEKAKLRKDESIEEEKSSTSKRDSLGKGKKLTLELPKGPDSPGKKLKKESGSPEGPLKSPETKNKPPKSPESPGQRLKNKVLGSPLLRGRKEQKTLGISFDDLSESSVTDSSRSDEPKIASETLLEKDDAKISGDNPLNLSSDADLKISNSKTSASGKTEINGDEKLSDGDLNVFPEKNKSRYPIKEAEQGLNSSVKTVNEEVNTPETEGGTPEAAETAQVAVSDNSANKNCGNEQMEAKLETPQNPIGSRVSPIGAEPPSPAKPSFLSVESIKVPMKKCTTPEISASVENLKKEYLMEMINKESALIELQMKLNQSEAMLKESNAKVAALEVEKQASMSRLHELDEALESTKHEAASFSTQLIKKSNQLSLLETSSHESARVVAELTARCRSLESQLQEKVQLITELEGFLNEEREKNKKLEDFDKLEAELKERDAYDAERDEEIRMLQEALEEALEEKNELEISLNMNASRETQLLEDFEWKLHEIERDYKSKISEAEAKAEERVRQELLEERKTILDERKRVEDQLKEVLHLKSFEAEVVQLRGLVIEQQRAIRVAARQIEQLKNDERILQDHVKKLKKNDEHHSKRVMLDEESLKKRIEEARLEITGEWEDKFKRECQRLRVELDAIHQEEKTLAIESLRLQKDQELQDVKTALESKQRELLARIAELQDKLVLKDHSFGRQIEVVKSQAERDISDARKQAEKSNLAHAEELDKLANEHKLELERLQEECENRVSANIDFAVREKLERTKRELEQAYDEKVESLTKQHQAQINALQNQIEEEKQDALTMLEEHYRGQLLMLQEHAQMLQKKVAESDAQWQAEIRRLRHIITTKEEEVKKIQDELQQNLEIIDSQSTENHIIKTSLETHRYELQQLKQLDEILKQENYKLKNDNVVLKQELVTILDVLSRERQERYEEQQELLRSRERRDTEVDWKSDDGLSSDSPPTGRGPGDGQSPSPTRNLSSKSCDNHVDIQVILEMQQVMADKEAELQRLTEEKRFYQLELIYWERNLANIRPGVPLSLEPYRSDSLRTYSAPPVTKPRLYEKVRSEAVSRVTSSGDLLDGNFDNFAQTVFSGSEGSDGGFTTPIEESYRGFSL